MDLFPKCYKCNKPIFDAYHDCPIGTICPKCFIELPKNGEHDCE